MITPVGARASDLFGYSISVARDMLVVGAPGVDAYRPNLANLLTDVGAVFVYARNPGYVEEGMEMRKWTQTQKLMQTSGADVRDGVGTRVGFSVAVDAEGDTVVSGGPYHDVTDALRGGVNNVRYASM